MALIKCPECNKEISDKSEKCVNCGYPLTSINNKVASTDGMNVCTSCGNFMMNVAICPECNGKMVDCHCTEEEWTDMLLNGTLEKWEKQMRGKYVISNENFNKDLYSKTIAEEKEEDEYYQELEKQCVSSPQVECPYCKSNNTKKITSTAKAVNIALFGIFGNKRKYQWHCNNCKSDF